MRSEQPDIEAEIPRMSAAMAVVAVILAFGSAAGVGHLVAGVVGHVRTGVNASMSSPYVAVANAVARNAPPGLVGSGTASPAPGVPAAQAHTAGPGLLIGLGLLLLLIAVPVGLASRQRERPGRRSIFVLGLIGLLAVITTALADYIDLAAPLFAIGVGLRAFRYLHAKALSQVRQAQPGYKMVLGEDSKGRRTADAVFGEVSRRDLLFSGAVVGVVAASAGVGGLLLGAGQPQPPKARP